MGAGFARLFGGKQDGGAAGGASASAQSDGSQPAQAQQSSDGVLPAVGNSSIVGSDSSQSAALVQPSDGIASAPSVPADLPPAVQAAADQAPVVDQAPIADQAPVVDQAGSSSPGPNKRSADGGEVAAGSPPKRASLADSSDDDGSGGAGSGQGQGGGDGPVGGDQA